MNNNNIRLEYIKRYEEEEAKRYNEWRSNSSRRSNNRNNISCTNDNNNRDNIRENIIAPKRRHRGEVKTLIGCIAIITAGILLNNNSDYSVLLKTLGLILIVIIIKLFEGEC